MAEEIRGLSIKFDADFSEFKKNMNSAEKDISSTQRKLKTLQDSLKMEWDPKKFTRAQSEAQKALDATEKKASLLRKRLAEMEEVGVTEETRNQYNWLTEQLEKTDLNAQKLKNDLEKLDEIKLKQLTAGLDDTTKKLDKAATATKALSKAAAATVAGLAALGLNAVSQADKVATLATQYDMTTDAIQRFNYVALQTDTEAEQLYKSFVKVQGAVADMNTGVESVTTKALKQLNLSFEEIEGNEAQFYAIIDTLSKMEDQSKMVSLANDIFGEKMATNLFPLIYAGTDAIKEYREEFETLGALSENQVSQLADYDNELNKLKVQYQNAALQLGSELLPVMKTFSEMLTNDILPVIKNLVQWFSELDKEEQKNVISLLFLIATLSPALKLMSDLGKGISGLINWLGKLDGAALKTYASWGLLLAAVGSLFYLLANWSNMNPVQKIVGLLGALTAVALAAGIAMGVFQSALSWGAAAAGIVAGIVAVTAAVKSAGDQASESTGDLASAGYSTAYNPVADMNLSNMTPTSSSVTTNDNSYVDNSTVTINIEKNEYMSEDEIIRAVNKGLKLAKQSRT